MAQRFERSALFRHCASDDIDGYFPGSAIIANLRALKSYWLPVALAGFVILPLSRRGARRRIIALWNARSGLVLAAAAPIIFLEALSNHAQIHAAFTQINFAPAFMLAGLAVARSPALVVENSDHHMIRAE